MSSPGLTGRSSIPETPRLESKSRGVLDAPVKPGHDSGGGERRRSRGTFCPSFASSFVPRKSEDAGNAGASVAPAALRATKKSTQASHHRYAETIRHSLHDGLRLMACSPR